MPPPPPPLPPVAWPSLPVYPSLPAYPAYPSLPAYPALPGFLQPSPQAQATWAAQLALLQAQVQALWAQFAASYWRQG